MLAGHSRSPTSQATHGSSPKLQRARLSHKGRACQSGDGCTERGVRAQKRLLLERGTAATNAANVLPGCVSQGFRALLHRRRRTDPPRRCRGRANPTRGRRATPVMVVRREASVKKMLLLERETNATNTANILPGCVAQGIRALLHRWRRPDPPRSYRGRATPTRRERVTSTRAAAGAACGGP